SFPVIGGEPSAREHITLPSPGNEGRIATVAQQMLLDQFAPASVVVNRKMEILYYSGPTHDYLINPSGVATHDLLTMTREGLRSRLRGAMQKAIDEGQPVYLPDARVKRGKTFHPVRVTITPVPQGTGRDGLLLIIFEEEG